MICLALLATVLENNLLELLEVVGDLVALLDLTELGVRAGLGSDWIDWSVMRSLETDQAAGGLSGIVMGPLGTTVLCAVVMSAGAKHHFTSSLDFVISINLLFAFLRSLISQSLD